MIKSIIYKPTRGFSSYFFSFINWFLNISFPVRRSKFHQVFIFVSTFWNSFQISVLPSMSKKFQELSEKHVQQQVRCVTWHFPSTVMTFLYDSSYPSFSQYFEAQFKFLHTDGSVTRKIDLISGRRGCTNRGDQRSVTIVQHPRILSLTNENYSQNGFTSL